MKYWGCIFGIIFSAAGVLGGTLLSSQTWDDYLFGGVNFLHHRGCNNTMTLSEVKWGLIAPALKEIGLYSDTALNLVTGTGLVESGYKTTVQYGGGPALGWFQMEPATHDDCWQNYLRYRPELARAVSALCRDEKPSAGLLQFNPAYAAAMCRVKYLRVPAPLPPNDAQSLSLYHKRYYNTMQGKADATKNIPLFQEAIDA